MTNTITAKVSADASNAVTFGTDGGLYSTGPTSPPRGGDYATTLDNSWAAAGQAWWYSHPGYNALSITMTSGTAFVFPVSVSRRARITAGVINVVTAGTGSTVYTSLYASEAVQGLPAAKLADLFSVAGTPAGLNAPTAAIDSTTSLDPFVRYWLAVWAYTTSGLPSVSSRSGGSGYGLGQIPRPTLPTAATTYTTVPQLGYLDTSVAWASRTTAPSTLGVTFASTTTAAVPQPVFQLTNV